VVIIVINGFTGWPNKVSPSAFIPEIENAQKPLQSAIRATNIKKAPRL